MLVVSIFIWFNKDTKNEDSKRLFFFFFFKYVVWLSFSMVEEILKELLEEVRAIKKASVPPPVAPEKPPEGFIEEFKVFLSKYGVISLAVAFIFGGAAGRLVSALVNDILMPVITFFISDGAWREATLTIGPIVLLVGHFVAAIIDFLIIALVAFWLMKAIDKTSLK